MNERFTCDAPVATRVVGKGHSILLLFFSFFFSSQKRHQAKENKETGRRKEDCSSKQQAASRYEIQSLFFILFSKFVAVATVEPEAETEAAETDHAIIMEFVLFSPSGEG